MLDFHFRRINSNAITESKPGVSKPEATQNHQDRESRNLPQDIKVNLRRSDAIARLRGYKNCSDMPELAPGRFTVEK